MKITRNMNLTLLKKFLFFFVFIYHYYTFAVPLSFMQNAGTNMKDTEWQTIESDNFIIYYPKEAKNIASYSLHSLEKSYPYLSLLLGAKLNNSAIINSNRNTNRTITSKFKKIPFIIGNHYDGAGFANPVTLNIEAQILHNRPSAFFQHELVHRLMYEHNDFGIGPIARLFSLAMMPTWWIEGLAEHLTNSIGENTSKNVLKNMALTNHWPTWDRLHSLYQADADTNLRGYVTAGYFLGWIFSKLNNPDLFEIHKEISNKTVTPPFYNAADSWLNKKLGKTAEELYEQFKIEMENEWKNKINNLPELIKEKTFNSDLGQKYFYPIVNLNNETIYSKLVAENSPYGSAFYINNFKAEIRLPVSFAGSSSFAIGKNQPLELVTAQLHTFNNGKIGHDLIIIQSPEQLHNLSNKNYFQKEIKFSNAENPYFIDSITHLKDTFYIINTINNGNPELFLLNTNNSEIKLIKSYQFPLNIKFFSTASKNNCTYFILDSDENKTSLQNICIDNNSSAFIQEAIPNAKFIITDGYVRNSNSVLLKVIWNDLHALIEFKPLEKKYTSLFLFSEWIENIIPSAKDPQNEITFWYYFKGKYYLKNLNLNNAIENFKQWDKQQTFLNFENYEFHEYKPPYKNIFTEKKQLFSIPEISEVTAVEDKLQSNTTAHSNEKGALYQSRFLFAYPYALPDFFGGPSIGLFSIPFMDEIERYRIVLFGGYNFYLNAPEGSITYVNNRIFDSFSLSLFANPFFNGYYDIGNNKTTTRYYNYLQQTGISVNTAWRFKPLNTILTVQSALYNLEPYDNLKTPPPEVGAQKTNLMSVGGNLKLDVINEYFYLSKQNKINGEWLNLLMSTTFGGSQYYGLGKSQDSNGHNTGTIDYYNLYTSLKNTLNFYRTNLTLLGKLSTTQGQNTLNIKEVYSPYQSYILGSNTPLNFISYPIIGNGSLFELKAGYWSYSGTVGYDFPIYPKFEKKLLFTYLNNLRGIVTLTRGGVAIKEDFNDFSAITSASVGSSVDVDIKGFQLFPSFYYSWIVGQETNWYILFQLKFMDFL